LSHRGRLSFTGRLPRSPGSKQLSTRWRSLVALPVPAPAPGLMPRLLCPQSLTPFFRSNPTMTSEHDPSRQRLPLLLDLVVGTIGMIGFILLLASSSSAPRRGTDAAHVSSPYKIGGRS
jgi:hypothetical protein